MIYGEERERLREAMSTLRAAEKPVRILRTIEWGAAVMERFFAEECRELPRVEYTPLDPTLSLEAVAEVRRTAQGDTPVHAWLLRAAASIEDGARMLAAVGTADFHEHSKRLYGAPKLPLDDGRTTSLDLARQLDQSLPPWAEDTSLLECYLSISAFLNRIDVSRMHGHYESMLSDAPRVVVDDERMRGARGRGDAEG